MPKTLYITTHEKWRAWLAKNHASEAEIWLIYFKEHTAKPRIPYDHAVEEALCFGWIDSIVRRIDDERYAQKFTPRRDPTKWSASNKQRMRTLIRAGRMTEAGLAKIDRSLLDEEPQTGKEPKKDAAIPRLVKEALAASPRAREFFQTLAPSYRRLFIKWILSAKKEETRNRRLQQTVALLRQNKKLGLK